MQFEPNRSSKELFYSETLTEFPIKVLFQDEDYYGEIRISPKNKKLTFIGLDEKSPVRAEIDKCKRVIFEICKKIFSINDTDFKITNDDENNERCKGGCVHVIPSNLQKNKGLKLEEQQEMFQKIFLEDKHGFKNEAGKLILKA